MSDSMSSWRLQRFPSAHPVAALAWRGAAIVLALMISGSILAAMGSKPLSLGYEVLKSSVGSEFGLEDLALIVTPLILTGLAVAVTMRVGIWNIGAEGQFYMGAFCTGAVGLFLDGPWILMITAMAVAGILGGALWILVPALARAYANVNELITTLLLNFVATLLVYYVATGPWHEQGVMTLGSTRKISYAIPEFYDTVHYGLPLAIATAIAMAGVLTFTKWGYEVRVSGANPNAALYAGIPIRRRIIVAMLISGGIAGAAGMLEVAGTVHRLQGGIANNYGYVGIMVAVLARGSCLGVLPTAVMMAIILNSGIVLQTRGVFISTVVAVTGLILLLTAIGDEFAHYRIARTDRKLEGGK
jgi:general nucleoside transport system permease protein